MFKGYNPFEIKDFHKEHAEMHGTRPKTANDDLFESAKQDYDSQSKESMNRHHLNLREINGMMPVARVLAGLGLLGMTYKAVDVYVT